MQHGECVVRLLALGLWGKEAEADLLKDGDSLPLYLQEWSSPVGRRARAWGRPRRLCRRCPPTPIPLKELSLGHWGPCSRDRQVLGPWPSEGGSGVAAAQHLREANEWEGGRGEQERQSFGSGISKGQPRGRIQKPKGRLARLPGSAFVRLWPPCAEEAGGCARDPASAAAAVSPQPPRAGGRGARGDARAGAARCVGRVRAARGAAGAGAGGGRGAGAAAPSARAPAAALAPAGLRPRRCGAGPLGMGGGGRPRELPLPLPPVARRKLGECRFFFSPHLGSGAFFHYPGWTFKNTNYFFKLEETMLVSRKSGASPKYASC